MSPDAAPHEDVQDLLGRPVVRELVLPDLQAGSEILGFGEPAGDLGVPDHAFRFEGRSDAPERVSGLDLERESPRALGSLRHWL